jgi:hypothetical protein
LINEVIVSYIYYLFFFLHSIFLGLVPRERNGYNLAAEQQCPKHHGKRRGVESSAGAVKNRKDGKRFGVVCLCVTAAAAAAGRAAIAVISPRPICSGVVFFFFR